MAKIETAVIIDIKVNDDGTVKQAVGLYEDLGDAVAKTQLQAEKLAKQFGINDARTQEAIRVAAQYKNQMEQLDFAIEGAKGGTETLFRATQGILGGFEAAAGAAALFGVESEDLERTLVRLQAAMVLSQGLKDFREFLPAIRDLAESIRKQLIPAFQSVRGALIATGWGAAAVAVGYLLVQLDKLIGSTNEASEAQDGYNQKLRDFALERLRLTKGEKAALEVQLQLAKQEQERNNQFIKDYNKRVGVLQELKAIGIDAETSIDRQRAATAKNLVLRNKELTNDILKFNARIRQIEEQTQAEKDRRQATAVKKTEENLQKEIDLYEWYLGEVQKVFGEISKGITTTTETTVQATTTQITYAGQATYDQLDRTKLFIKAYSADIAKTIVDSLQAGAAIADAFAGADVERQRKAFQLNKAAAIASTTLSTIEGAQNAYSKAKLNPLDQITLGAYSVTQAGIALAFGLAQVKKIQATQFQSTSPGTLGGTGVQQFPAPRAFQASTLGQDFSGQTKVYVTEGDITKTQRRVQNLQRVSVVGG